MPRNLSIRLMPMIQVRACQQSSSWSFCVSDRNARTGSMYRRSEMS